MLRGHPHNIFDVLSPETPELMKKIQEMKDPAKQQEMQNNMQGGMGGGMQGAGVQGAQEDPSVAANKQVFSNALKSILSGQGAPKPEGAAAEGAEGQEGQEGEGGGAEGGEQPATSAPSKPDTSGETGPFAAALAQIQEKQKEQPPSSEAEGEQPSAESNG